MVMGMKVHYVQITPLMKGGFEVACSCYWSKKIESQNEARVQAHLHIVERYAA
jgi:hypothetical protein